MTCAELVDLVTEYLEGTLSEAERARFDEHVAECPMCRVHLDRMQRIIRELGALHERDIEPAVLADMQSRFHDWRAAG